MTLAAVGLELRRIRGLLAALIVALALYAGVIAGFYPTMRDNTALIDEYMNILPQGILAAFGMSGSLGEPGVFYTTYIGSLLWPFIAAVAAVALGTRPVAADLDRGWLEVTLATPLSRVRLLAVAIAAQIGTLAVLATATVLSVLAGGFVVGASFDSGRFLSAVPIEFAVGAAIAGPVTLLSVVTLSRARTAGIAVGVLLAMYLARILVAIDPRLGWVGELSLFTHADTTALIANGSFPVADTVLLLTVAIASWLAALVLFRRRDLAA